MARQSLLAHADWCQSMRRDFQGVAIPETSRIWSTDSSLIEIASDRVELPWSACFASFRQAIWLLGLYQGLPAGVTRRHGPTGCSLSTRRGSS